MPSQVIRLRLEYNNLALIKKKALSMESQKSFHLAKNLMIKLYAI